MNKNITKLCVVWPLKAMPHWFQPEVDRFQAFVSEFPDCKVLDFLKKNVVAGRDPYRLEKECMEQAHLVVFLPEFSSNLVAYLLSLRIEKLEKPTLILGSRNAEISETFISAVRDHPDTCLLERYGSRESLEWEGVPIARRALDHFKPQIDAMKELEQLRRECSPRKLAAIA